MKDTHNSLMIANMVGFTCRGGSVLEDASADSSKLCHPVATDLVGAP